MKIDQNSQSVKSKVGKTPKVLVLMATYNGSRWLSEQLESILAQDRVDVHVVIGDDASKDDTCEMIQSRWGGDARVQLVSWPSPSGSAGANFRRLYRYVDVSDFSYVALADQDDVWKTDKLSAAIQMLTERDGDGYSCSVESFWPDGRTKVVSQCQETRNADYLFEGGGQGCTFVITQKLFLRLQHFCKDFPDLANAMHYHDWLIYLVARVSGATWCFDKNPYMRYRQHGGNEIGSRGGLGAITRRLELIKKGWYRDQICSALAIVKALSSDVSVLAGFERVFNSPKAISRQAYLAYYMFMHGRRRLADRGVLAFAALRGWI